jgi:hypothetical protein
MAPLDTGPPPENGRAGARAAADSSENITTNGANNTPDRPDTASLYPQAWIIGRDDGRFVTASEFEPGSILAEIMLIRALVDDPLEQLGDVVDAVGWSADDPGNWWTINGTTYLGEWELRRSWWDQTPARMKSTPAAHARDSASFVILDWSADVDDILGPVPGVICDTPELVSRLRRTMFLQAAPRRRILESAIRKFPISVAPRAIARAA